MNGLNDIRRRRGETVRAEIFSCEAYGIAKDEHKIKCRSSDLI